MWCYPQTKRPSCVDFLLSSYLAVFFITGLVFLHALVELRNNPRAAGGGINTEDNNNSDDDDVLIARYLASTVDGGGDERGHLTRLYLSIAEKWRNGVSDGILQRIPKTASVGVTSSCEIIDRLRDFSFLAGGWTKAVYKAQLDKDEVAVKVVNVHGHDFAICRNSGLDEDACYRKTAAKLIKEVVLLEQLQHPNIVQVRGQCVPGSDFTNAARESLQVLLVTELGDALDTIRLLQMPWEDRLRVAYDTANLLRFLATSPMGSLAMNDLRRQQFVLVNNQLKLSDVDDVGVEEKTCNSDDQCVILNESESNGTVLRVPCVRQRCVGYNEKINILSAGRNLVVPFLALGAPEYLRDQIDVLINAYKTAAMDTLEIQEATHRIVEHYARGKAKRKESKGFTKISDHDLTGRYDYYCPGSYSSAACVLSVSGPNEAMYICKRDAKCSSVVISPDKTWTGRSMAFFKSGSQSPVRHAKYTLLVRN